MAYSFSRSVEKDFEFYQQNKKQQLLLFFCNSLHVYVIHLKRGFKWHVNTYLQRVVPTEKVRKKTNFVCDNE